MATATINYDMPEDWQRADTSFRGIATSTWTPKQNAAHESVVVIRTERSPAVAGAGAGVIERMLVAAQGSFYDAKVGQVSSISTTHGLHGARIELDYIPPGAKARYHRMHAVLVDGTALIHVLYTAQSTDSVEAFETVLATLGHEEVRP